MKTENTLARNLDFAADKASYDAACKRQMCIRDRGNDHTAIELKNIIKEFVEGKGYEVIDLGTNSTESCDYPVYGEKVCLLYTSRCV